MLVLGDGIDNYYWAIVGGVHFGSCSLGMCRDAMVHSSDKCAEEDIRTQYAVCIFSAVTFRLWSQRRRTQNEGVVDAKSDVTS